MHSHMYVATASVKWCIHDVASANRSSYILNGGCSLASAQF